MASTGKLSTKITAELLSSLGEEGRRWSGHTSGGRRPPDLATEVGRGGGPLNRNISDSRAPLPATNQPPLLL